MAEDSVANLENRTIGKPSWKISFKLEDNKDWKDNLNIDGSEIVDLVTNENLYDFTLKLSSKDDFDIFFTTLALKGAIFRAIEPVKTSLEDVFMKLTSIKEERKEEK